MLSLLAVTLAVSAVVSAGVTPLVIVLAHRCGLVDRPDDGRRRVHTRAVPRLGGVAVVGGAAAGLFVLRLGGGSFMAPLMVRPDFFFGAALGAAILLGTGVIDDLFGLRPSTKLLSQILAASTLCAFGFSIESIGLGTGPGIQLGIFAVPLTIVWVVAVTNAFNLIDGIDGLATGLAIVALTTLLGVAAVIGRLEVAGLCAAMIGALLGFLPFNFNPARIFLGDSGSLAIGFILAVLSVHGATTSTATALALVPLFLLALPLIDTALAIMRRLLRNLPISAADRRHIHHRMLEMGFTTRRSVLILYSIATILGLAGALTALSPPTSVVLLTIAGGAVTLGLVLMGIRRLDYYEFAAVGAMMTHWPIKLRKILSDRINAQDIARVIGAAKSLDEVNTILGERASLFYFGHMEVCAQRSDESQARIYARWHTSAWKIDHPVSEYDPETKDWYVFRIWCRTGYGFRPYGAERVAGILAPVVEEWLRVAGRVPAQAGPAELGESGRERNWNEKVSIGV